MNEIYPNHADVAPCELTSSQKYDFRDAVNVLINESSYARAEEDGFTATFKLPHTAVDEHIYLTVRSIFRKSNEYNVGWYVTREQFLGAYYADEGDFSKGKREAYLVKNFSLGKARYTTDFSSYIYEIDDDGDEWTYSPADLVPGVAAETIRETQANLARHYQQIGMLQESLGDDLFDQSQLVELLHDMSQLDGSHQVSPFDEVLRYE